MAKEVANLAERSRQQEARAFQWVKERLDVDFQQVGPDGLATKV
jgi:hypothetical protein